MVSTCGTAGDINKNRFRYDPSYFGFDPERLWSGITLCIEADGDDEYKSAVQEVNIRLK